MISTHCFLKVIPGRLQSMGSLRVRHDWETWLSLFTFMHWRRKWQPTPSVLAWRIPGTGEPSGLPSMGSQSRTRLKWLSSSSDLSKKYFIYFWLNQVLVVVCGLLSSCDALAPEFMGSVTEAQWLSCFLACGILVSWPGIKPEFPALKGGF